MLMSPPLYLYRPHTIADAGTVVTLRATLAKRAPVHSGDLPATMWHRVLPGTRFKLVDEEDYNDHYRVTTLDASETTPPVPVHLAYFQDWSKYGNFGDELSRVIVEHLLGPGYTLVDDAAQAAHKLVAIGSYLQYTPDRAVVFGTGVRTDPPTEGGHDYTTLDVRAVRGPRTRAFLMAKGIDVPEVYGDPGLLLPRFYTVRPVPALNDAIAVVPNLSQLDRYAHLPKAADVVAAVGECIDEDTDSVTVPRFVLVSPIDPWPLVVDRLCACKAVVSSSLHGLVIADAYGRPNVWLNEHTLPEGEHKMHDYFESQGRQAVCVRSLDTYTSEKLYTDGNTLDLDRLVEAFPFV